MSALWLAQSFTDADGNVSTQQIEVEPAPAPAPSDVQEA